MNAMKILYHHRTVSKDGQFVHIDELTRQLRALGHELVIVSPAFTEQDDFSGEGGFVTRLRQSLPRWMSEFLEFCYCFVAFFKLRSALKTHRPDCLYERYNLFLPSGIWIKKLYGIPFVSEVNAPLLDERTKFEGVGLPRFARWTEHYVWRNADVVLPVTKVLADRIMREGVDSSKIVVIHNGIDVNRFAEPPDVEAAKEKLGLTGKTVLGFTGFMREWHHLERVVEKVAADDTGRRFALLVGDGPARESIEKRASELGVSDRVRITGVVDRASVFDYVAAFDIALQPNVVEYASPLKMFEYMVLAKAIVAPDTANIREILTDGVDCAMFRPGDTRDFYTKIDDLLADDERRARLQQAARRTVFDKGFTWQENARRVTGLCADLVAARQGIQSSSWTDEQSGRR